MRSLFANEGGQLTFQDACSLAARCLLHARTVGEMVCAGQVICLVGAHPSQVAVLSCCRGGWSVSPPSGTIAGNAVSAWDVWRNAVEVGGQPATVCLHEACLYKSQARCRSTRTEVEGPRRDSGTDRTSYPYP